MKTSARLLAGLGLAASMAACSGSAKRPSAEAGPLLVQVSSILGGAAAEGGLSPAELSARVEKLLREGRRNSAERLVRRHPDTAYLALSDGEIGMPLLAIAAFHDRHSSLQGTASGWEALLRDRIGSPERYAAYDAARGRLLRLLREGRIEDAAGEGAPPVSEDSPAGPLLRTESARLHATVLLLAERPAEAAAALEPGLRAARAGRPLDAAQLLLLLCEARRRTGDAEASRAAWTEAVELAAGLLGRADDLFDLAVWERALNLKASSAAWPAAAREVLFRRAEAVVGPVPADVTPEAALRVCLGARRLARGEARAALVAFSHNEGAGAWKDLLRIEQARTLLTLGQVSAARALLAPLAGRKEGTGVRSAESVLGALELKVGALDRARILLQKSAEGAGDEDWPGRAAAEANLGLTLLSSGQETEGLRWLRGAQSRFEAARDPDGLLQALRNELRWAEQAGRDAAAEKAREKLAALEGV